MVQDDREFGICIGWKEKKILNKNKNKKEEEEKTQNSYFLE